MSEDVIYTNLFLIINNFEEQAKKTSPGQDRTFLENYFKTKLNLDENQIQLLKITANNFALKFTRSKNEDKSKLFLSHKNTLKETLGKSEFSRFDTLVKEILVQKMSIGRDDDQLGYGGYSDLTVDYPAHKLIGVSTTIAYDFQSAGHTCSVSATMTGPGVSLSNSASNDCSSFPSVTMTSTTYNLNSEYCVNGTHTRINTTTSNFCATPTVVPHITSVVYEQILTDDLPIDANPEDNNTSIANGLRIFPDRKTPSETVDRRKIRVKAQYYQATSNVMVLFRNFDPDDPSANTAPIDVETTANAGDDNNGDVDGTAATQKGKFSIPSPNPYNCQSWTHGLLCFTDSTGLAVAEFTVTKQPGDNFTVAAGINDVYLGNLTLAADGVNLKDTNNNPTPVTITGNNTCTDTGVSACRADMLTVWRRLHIEKDRMGTVTGNKVTGQINGAVTVPRAVGLTPGSATVNLSGISNLDTNQYWFGRLVVGGDSFKVTSNTANTITVENSNSRAITINNGADFTLYDDDDYNDNDGLTYVGDEGQTISEFSNSLQHMQVADGNYGDGTPRNVFSSAYIKPEYNWASSYNNIVPFDLNVTDAEVQGTASTSLMNANRGSKNDENDDFWIAYLIFGYQPATNEDFDPAGEGLVVGKSPGPTCDCYLSSVCPRSSSTTTVVCGANIPAGTQGSVIFLETSTDGKKFWANPQQTAPTFPIPPRVFNEAETTVPHEVGHQFGLLGDQTSTLFKIMDYQDPVSSSGNVAVAFHPEHINIMRKRIHSPGI